ncbi:hypothetical protein [Fictibacillus gelatini]|uniref:hypothetical protein n=1 Tax=Fictibacillus gelatini TaxID=225985 RepID=UPI00041215E4|nr:hypothetical protein [Fictibacillus gelatini]
MNEVKVYYLSPDELEHYRSLPPQKGLNLEGANFMNSVDTALQSWAKRQKIIRGPQRKVDWTWPLARKG